VLPCQPNKPFGDHRPDKKRFALTIRKSHPHDLQRSDSDKAKVAIDNDRPKRKRVKHVSVKVFRAEGKQPFPVQAREPPQDANRSSLTPWHTSGNWRRSASCPSTARRRRLTSGGSRCGSSFRRSSAKERRPATGLTPSESPGRTTRSPHPNKKEWSRRNASKRRRNRRS
jgi:hypothetical protein